MPIDHEGIYFRAVITEVLPNLFLGNDIAAADQGLLAQHKIRRILTVMQDETPRLDGLCRELDIGHKRFPIHDHEEFADEQGVVAGTLLPWIQESRLCGSPILIHCEAGISRSPALVLTFLVWKDFDFDEALKLVSKHEPAAPSPIVLESFLKCIGCQLPDTYPEWWLKRVAPEPSA